MEGKVQMEDMARFRENLMHIIQFTPEPAVEEADSIPMENLQSSDAEDIRRNETPREELDQISVSSEDSGQQMMHIKENQDANLLHARRLYFAKMTYVCLAGLVLFLAFVFLVCFFTKGKKMYIQHRENVVDENAGTEKPKKSL